MSGQAWPYTNDITIRNSFINMESRLNHSFIVTVEAMFSALLSLSVYLLVLTKCLMLCKC